MTYKASALINKKVSIKGCKQKEKLIHFLIHPNNGLVLGGVNRNQPFVIEKIDKEGIIATPLLKNDKEHFNLALQQKTFVIKAKVETESGHYLGRVVDFEFDDISWQIERVFVSDKVLFRALAGALQITRADILSIDKNKIIVRDGLVKRGADEETQVKSEYVSVGTGATLLGK